MKQAFGVAVALAMFAGQPAIGALVITEVMSSSNQLDSAINGDWFELSNTGAPVNLAGYYWDDDGPTGNDGAAFPNITINTNETVVIVQEDNADLAAFVAAWGGGFTAISREVFGGPDNFSGLSSGGDQIEIWNADPNSGPADLVASAVFGSADGGNKSFEWFTDGTADGFSVDGENGAYVGLGTDPANVGSPGIAVVPEPATVALIALGGVGLIRRRR